MITLFRLVTAAALLALIPSIAALASFAAIPAGASVLRESLTAFLICTAIGAAAAGASQRFHADSLAAGLFGGGLLSLAIAMGFSTQFLGGLGAAAFGGLILIAIIMIARRRLGAERSPAA